MTEIKNAFYSIAIVAIISGILDIFTKSSKHRKYIQYIISLIVIAALLSPIQSAINSIYELDLKYKDESTLYESQAEEYLCTTYIKAVTNDISNKYKIPTEALKINVKTDNYTVIESITIYINNSTYFRYAERIQVYINDEYGCEVEVIQRFDEND